jgi:hypothetical protein
MNEAQIKAQEIFDRYYLICEYGDLAKRCSLSEANAIKKQAKDWGVVSVDTFWMQVINNLKMM